MRVADYIFDFLGSYGVEHVFTVSGGGAIFLCDALGQAAKIQYVACHHEQSASMASEAYARTRNALGVTLVTSGPGGTNAITGTAGCWLDHVPQLTISGQVFLNQTIGKHPGLRTLGVQEINIVDMVRPITKYAVMVEDAQEIRYHLEKAVYLASHGRPGPTWIDVPANIQAAEVDPASLRAFDRQEVVAQDDDGLDAKIEQVVQMLKSAKRPLIHVGQGVRIAGAIDTFFNLIGHAGIPYVTARNANDLGYDDHPLYLGHPGTFAQRGANFAVQTADVYLAVGTRLALAQTGYNAKDYARQARTVMVDIDEAELNKDTVRIDLKIQADAHLFLRKLAQRLLGQDMLGESWPSWVAQCQKWRQRYPVVLPEYAAQTKYINSYHFIDVLAQVLTPDDVVVTDMGFAFQNTHQAFRVKAGQRVFTNCGLASMGWGLPAALGACFAREQKRTVCIAGDGGFMMTMQELATVMHHQLPIKLFILNNDGYLTIKQTQQSGFEGRLMGCGTESGLSFPDFMAIAQAHRIHSVRLRGPENLRQKIEEIMAFTGPVVCEIMMDPDQLQAPKAVSRKNAAGFVQQTPIEDSFPFLDPQEVNHNLRMFDEN